VRNIAVFTAAIYSQPQLFSRSSTAASTGVNTSTDAILRRIDHRHETGSCCATIEELQEKAAACEEKAKGEPEPEATKLREEALLYREWIAVLSSGRWHS
jgi:hypothetical protein